MDAGSLSINPRTCRPFQIPRLRAGDLGGENPGRSARPLSARRAGPVGRQRRTTRMAACKKLNEGGRRARIGLPSVARCMCQAPYDRPQHGLLNRFSCFFNREPFHLTLPPLRPLFPLSLYPQRVDVHFTDHNAAVLKALFVWKRSNGTSADRSNNTGFFKSFARSRMMRRFALLGPALWNYPASCPS